jgi:hypothetical protein
MYRSPPQLRSGSKGKPVALSSTDKPGLQRSLSASSALSPPAKSTMPNQNKDIDPEIIKSAVKSHLSSEGGMSELIARLTTEIKTIVEEAITTALKPLSDEVARLQNEVIELRTKLREVADNCTDRADELEQYQRRNNLRFFGIKEAKTEDTDALVIQLCREKLDIELPADAICRSHRVGKLPAQPATDGSSRPRPIIVRFVGYRYRQRVFAAKKKLKGSGVTVREDLTARRMEVYRTAAEKHGVRNTWTLDGRVLWLDSQGRKGVATRMAEV